MKNWKLRPKTAALVVNDVPWEDEGYAKRQKYAFEVLRELPESNWFRPHFLKMRYDDPKGELLRDLAEEIGGENHFPFIREMMRYAIAQDCEWAGVMNSDVIISEPLFDVLQLTACNVVSLHVSDIPCPPEDADTIYTPYVRHNTLSTDGLFIRGEAIPEFLRSFPDYTLGTGWDHGLVYWIRRYKHLRAVVTNKHECLHVAHDSLTSHSKGVQGDQDNPNGIKASDIYNRSLLHQFLRSHIK